MYTPSEFRSVNPEIQAVWRRSTEVTAMARRPSKQGKRRGVPTACSTGPSGAASAVPAGEPVPIPPTELTVLLPLRSLIIGAER